MHSVNIIDDISLLTLLQKGDHSAFERLYTMYHKVLYLHAYSILRDREVAKDIVQDLFVTIWDKRETLEIKSKFSHYLNVSIRNKVLDYIAREKSKSRYLASLNNYIESNHSLTDYTLREKMLQEQINSVLNCLSPRLREVFELSRVHYLTHKEISEKLNLSEQSVRSYIKSVLRVLRAKFGILPWALLILYCKYF